MSHSIYYGLYGHVSVLPKQIQSMVGGHDLGGAYDHIKAFGLTPFPYQRNICIEGMLRRHDLSMLGITLQVLNTSNLLFS